MMPGKVWTPLNTQTCQAEGEKDNKEREKVELLTHRETLAFKKRDLGTPMSTTMTFSHYSHLPILANLYANSSVLAYLKYVLYLTSMKYIDRPGRENIFPPLKRAKYPHKSLDGVSPSDRSQKQKDCLSPILCHVCLLRLVCFQWLTGISDDTNLIGPSLKSHSSSI